MNTSDSVIFPDLVFINIILSDHKRFVENGTGRRFQEISSSSDTIVLKYPGDVVSSRPIQSLEYANCNGVVLRSKNGAAGLSHYDLEPKPEIYLPQLIAEISTRCNCNNYELSAVPVGGDKNHFQRNMKILESYQIPIVGRYCDEWMDDGGMLFDMPGTKSTKGDKHLVAVPKTQEVLMYSRPVGYVSLTPRKI